MIQVFTEPPKDFDFTIRASSCCIHYQNKILILKDAEEGYWGLPGGGIEAGEAPREAALRELREETGIALDPFGVTKVGMLYIRRPEVDYTFYMFKGQIKEPVKVSLSFEHSDFKWITAEEFSGCTPLIPAGLEVFNYYLKCLENLELSKAHVNAHIIPIKNNQVMLSLRQNTGYFDDQYGLLAGHVERDESVRSGLIREIREEASLSLSPEQLKLVHTMHHLKDRNNVSLFFVCDNWEGEFINLEPYKCGGFAFFPLDNLPANVVPYVRDVLNHIQKGIHYSESGWAK